MAAYARGIQQLQQGAVRVGESSQGVAAGDELGDPLGEAALDVDEEASPIFYLESTSAAVKSADVRIHSLEAAQSLTTDQLSHLGTDSLNALGSAQFATLSSAQFGALTSDQLSKLETSDLRAVTTAALHTPAGNSPPGVP